jgi:hypothetical protein
VAVAVAVPSSAPTSDFSPTFFARKRTTTSAASRPFSPARSSSPIVRSSLSFSAAACSTQCRTFSIGKVQYMKNSTAKRKNAE